MQDLLSFAWSMSQEPPPARPRRRSSEELARHKAGDHGLCGPDRPGHGICTECGKTVQVTRSSAPPDRRRCRDCQRARPKAPLAAVPRICQLCEESYVPKPGFRPDQRFCSKSCTTAWANGARPPYRQGDPVTRKEARNRLRRQVHAETYDGVTNEQIIERDHWRCGICSQKIGKSFRWPHPRSASIDHVIPLSQGGDDTAANKRAAHLACNCGRMNRGGGEQLAMIG